MTRFMCTVSRAPYNSWCLILLTLIACSPAFAHPVAQGAVTLDISKRISMEMTVSLEQVLVASQWQQPAKRLDANLLREHGDYLLSHLKVSADQVPLTGELVSVPTEAKGALVYRLRYPLPNGHPASLNLSQNLLREIDFSPGNPWEVSYRLQAFKEGLLVADALFSPESPLLIDLTGETSVSTLTRDYLILGWQHILKGYDHLLFVGGLVLTAAKLRELGLIILLFTLAHSLTMTLAVLDWFRLSMRMVEPMIAFSIVVVSIQNVYWPAISGGKPRCFIAFGFGLFHGLGFAGGLLENVAELTANQVLWSIFAFALGVELGHLCVVLPVYGGFSALRRASVRRQAAEMLQRLGSLLIGACGLIYFYFALTAVWM